MSKMSEKRRRLTQIVSGMGPDATPAEIRQEAYRVGFGIVNAHMMRLVRNTLYPDRPKPSNGMRSDGKAKGGFTFTGQNLTCPQCSSDRTSVVGGYRRKRQPGFYIRERKCLACGHTWKAQEEDVKLPGRYTDKVKWALMTEKQCTYCNRTLPVEAYSLVTGSDVIRRPGCKECYANKRSEYIGRDLTKRYGITLDDYHAMLSRQGGRCAICGTDNAFGRLDNNLRKRKRRTFSVDHCHATGEVRGLLCARCNLAIGNFGDDTQCMRSAIAYIESHKSGGNL